MTTIQKNNVPKLRFPEFTKSWERTTLQGVADFIDSLHETPKQYANEGYPMVRVVDVKDTGLDLEKCIKVTEDVYKHFTKRYKPKNGDIIYSRVGTCGESVIINLKKDICLGQNIVLIKAKENSKFIFFYLKTPYVKNQVNKKVVGSSHKTLSLIDLKKFNIVFPQIEEQQKIASFLHLVNTKIDLLSKKINLLEDYKKGTMQNLFSQEFRFKDEHGDDFPDWVKLTLEDLYEFKPTNSLSREKLNYENGEVYNIHYGDIHTKFKSNFFLQHENVPFINIDVDIGRIPLDRFCSEGDLVIADASEDYADIGKTIELVNLNGKKVLAGLHTLLARPLSDNVFIGYGAHLMSSEPVRLQIKLIAQGTKVLGISTGRMNKIKLSLPSKLEQQKITNFLTMIDKKIILVTTELKQAQAFKKGLLQQMFI